MVNVIIRKDIKKYKMFYKIRVEVEAQSNEVIKKSEDTFHIKTKARPIAGLANKKVIQLLACYLRLPAGKVRIVKGFREPNKIIEVK